MVTNKLPKVLVLLATHNGEAWLVDQLGSIFNQKNVSLRVIVSDDGSTDNTSSLIEQHILFGDSLHFIDVIKSFGSAGKNFYHLIKFSDLQDAEYIALSDQDDIWFSEKMTRAISVLSHEDADGYSSDFIVWYPSDGRKINIKKSQPQTEFDYLFQGPGPGCTFVLRRAYFEDLRDLFISDEKKQIDEIFFHDWLIYAHARSRGKKWVIDPVPTMLYRQHQHNVAGASLGCTAIRKRFEMMKSGWYTNQILLQAKFLDFYNLWPIKLLRSNSKISRIRLIMKVNKLRRAFRDRIGLIIYLLFF